MPDQLHRRDSVPSRVLPSPPRPRHHPPDETPPDQHHNCASPEELRSAGGGRYPTTHDDILQRSFRDVVVIGKGQFSIRGETK